MDNRRDILEGIIGDKFEDQKTEKDIIHVFDIEIENIRKYEFNYL